MLEEHDIVTVLLAYNRSPAAYHVGAVLPLPFAKDIVMPSSVTDDALDSVKSVPHAFPILRASKKMIVVNSRPDVKVTFVFICI